MNNKELLYRKVNTTARFCHHKYGADYKHQRNKKNKDESMKQGVHRCKACLELEINILANVLEYGEMPDQHLIDQIFSWKKTRE